MSNMEVFETIHNETTRYADGKSFHTISTVCDRDGTFEIRVFGNGGVDGAKSAITRVLEILCQQQICEAEPPEGS